MGKEELKKELDRLKKVREEEETKRGLREQIRDLKRDIKRLKPSIFDHFKKEY